MMQVPLEVVIREPRRHWGDPLNSAQPNPYKKEKK